MKTLFLSLAFIFAGLTVTAQDLNLKVVIEDIKEKEGTIYIALHNNEKNFPNDDPYKTAKIEKFDKTAEYTFKDLKKGEYAVSIFQDLNGNGELDTNFVGFPKEPVGASNMTSLGRPKFSKCKFSLSADKTVSIQYMN